MVGLNASLAHQTEALRSMADRVRVGNVDRGAVSRRSAFGARSQIPLLYGQFYMQCVAGAEMGGGRCGKGASNSGHTGVGFTSVAIPSLLIKEVVRNSHEITPVFPAAVGSDGPRLALNARWDAVKPSRTVRKRWV